MTVEFGDDILTIFLIILLQLRVGSQDLICISIAKRLRDQLRPEKKKDTGGKFSLRAEKKKVPVVCLAGVSFFGPNPNPNSF